MEYKTVEVWIEGIKMEVSVSGYSYTTDQEWEQIARDIIKKRLLAYWNIEIPIMNKTIY